LYISTKPILSLALNVYLELLAENLSWFSNVRTNGKKYADDLRRYVNLHFSTQQKNWRVSLFRTVFSKKKLHFPPAQTWCRMLTHLSIWSLF
jgi:hypothetical protein